MLPLALLHNFKKTAALPLLTAFEIAPQGKTPNGAETMTMADSPSWSMANTLAPIIEGGNKVYS